MESRPTLSASPVADEAHEHASILPGWLLARLAHAARHTLTSVFGYADLLQDHADPAVQELVQIIQTSGEELQQQTRWARDLFLIESGHFALNPVAIDITACLDAVQAEPFLQRSGLNLTVQETADGTLRADAEAVRAVLRHVVHASASVDAVRQVLLRTQTRPEGHYVKIYDPARALPTDPEATFTTQIAAFESRYTQADEAVDLSSVLLNRYMRLLGGTVAYRPGPNDVGVLTVLKFPLEPARHAASPAAVPQKASVAPHGRQRLLVLEDDKITLRLMTRILEQEHDVNTASTPDEAIVLAQAHQYDAFLLDINVSDSVTGIDVLHAIRDMPKHQATPAIACSAYANKGDRELFSRVGFQAFVAKPFSKDRLFGALNRVIGQAALHRLEAALDKEVTLPTASRVLDPLVNALLGESEGAGFGEDPVLASLQADPFIGDWVLRHVNDGTYGLSRTVARPEHAVSLLGAERAGQLALVALLMRYAGRPYGDPVLRRIQETIVAQSLAAAAYARYLGETIAAVDGKRIMTAALVHATGRFSQARLFTEAFKRLWIQRKGGRASLREPTAGQEFIEFRVDYTQLGAQVLSHWHFPDAIIGLVKNQLQPVTMNEGQVLESLLLHVATQAAQAVLHPDAEHLQHEMTAPMMTYRIDEIVAQSGTPNHVIMQVLHTRAKEIRSYAMAAVNALRG
ncbi:MAG: HDOD domain-containing protein [Bacteroidota bacterium]